MMQLRYRKSSQGVSTLLCRRFHHTRSLFGLPLSLHPALPCLIVHATAIRFQSLAVTVLPHNSLHRSARAPYASTEASD